LPPAGRWPKCELIAPSVTGPLGFKELTREKYLHVIATECPPPQGIPVQSQSHERDEDVLAKSMGALQHLCRLRSADHLESVTLAQPGHLGALFRNTERDIGPNDGNVIEFGSRHKMFCELPKGNQPQLGRCEHHVHGEMKADEE